MFAERLLWGETSKVKTSAFFATHRSCCKAIIFYTKVFDAHAHTIFLGSQFIRYRQICFPQSFGHRTSIILHVSCGKEMLPDLRKKAASLQSPQTFWAVQAHRGEPSPLCRPDLSPLFVIQTECWIRIDIEYDYRYGNLKLFCVARASANPMSYASVYTKH